MFRSIMFVAALATLASCSVNIKPFTTVDWERAGPNCEQGGLRIFLHMDNSVTRFVCDPVAADAPCDVPEMAISVSETPADTGCTNGGRTIAVAEGNEPPYKEITLCHTQGDGIARLVAARTTKIGCSP